jgi:hypothetical protein
LRIYQGLDTMKLNKLLFIHIIELSVYAVCRHHGEPCHVHMMLQLSIASAPTP